MRHEILALDIPTSDGVAGTSRRIDDLESVAVYAHGTFNGSWKVQGKASGPNDPNDHWMDVPSGGITTAQVMIDIPKGFTHVRIFRTSVTSGALVACVSGKHSRTE